MTAAERGVSSRSDVPTHLNSVVAACLGWLNRNLPVADLHVIRRTKEGDGPEVVGHPFIALLDRPNPLADFHRFFAAILISDVCDGTTFLVKIRNGLRKIHSLWWVPPWDVKEVPNTGDDSAERPILRYRVSVAGGGVKEYPPEDVIVIADGFDPYNPYRGLAPLKAGIRATTTIDRAEAYTQILMLNCGAVPCVISPANVGDSIDPENIPRLKSQWRERQSELNAGTPFFATQGVRLDKVTLSPEEMALDKILQLPIATVCSLIGINPMVINLPDPGRTFSNYETSIRSAWESALIPRQARFAEALDRGCPELIHPTGERLKWCYDHVKALQDDWATKIDGLVKAVGGPFMTADEARAQVHLEPLPPGAVFGQAPQGPPQVVQAAPEPQPAPEPAKSVTVRLVDAKALPAPSDDSAARAYLAGLDFPDTPDGRRERCRAVAEKASEELRALAEALVDEVGGKGGISPIGEILEAKGLAESVGAFFRSMARTIRTGALAATLALRGDLTPAGRKALEAEVASQGEYLDGFRKAVLDGSQPPDGTLVARAGMYGKSLRNVAENVSRAEAIEGGSGWERRRHHGPDSPCSDCAAEVAKGWQPAGTLDPIGKSICKSGCHCVFELSDSEPTE
jgi:phage portal protein BeeE